MTFLTLKIYKVIITKGKQNNIFIQGIELTAVDGQEGICFPPVCQNWQPLDLWTKAVVVEV